MSKMMNVGDKVTIWDGPRYGKTTARAVVRVSEVGKRYLRTSDGRRWKVKGVIQHEVDNRGTEIGTASIREYADGDEDRAHRTMLLRSASRIVTFAYVNTESKLSLLSNADLKTLGEIAERLETAMKLADDALAKGPPAKTTHEPSKCKGASCGGLGGYHRPGCEGSDA